jgi:hypothetical protein
MKWYFFHRTHVDWIHTEQERKEERQSCVFLRLFTFVNLVLRFLMVYLWYNAYFYQYVVYVWAKGLTNLLTTKCIHARSKNDPLCFFPPSREFFFPISLFSFVLASRFRVTHSDIVLLIKLKIFENN